MIICLANTKKNTTNLSSNGPKKRLQMPAYGESWDKPEKKHPNPTPNLPKKYSSDSNLLRGRLVKSHLIFDGEKKHFDPSTLGPATENHRPNLPPLLCSMLIFQHLWAPTDDTVFLGGAALWNRVSTTFHPQNLCRTRPSRDLRELHINANKEVTFDESGLQLVMLQKSHSQPRFGCW